MNRKGFTLIELLVVVAVLALLASMVFSNLSGAREGARIANILSFQSQTHSLLGSDLVGWWPLNEGSGTTANDISGYNNHATLYNFSGNYWVDGISGTGGNALKFNGTNNFVRTGIIPASDSFAISIWFKTTTVRNGDRLYWGHGTNRAILANSGTGGNLTWYVQTNVTNTGYKVTADRFVLNEWNNVILQYTGTQVESFINGVQDSVTENITGRSNASAFNLGTNYNNTSNWYNGTIDDVRIYSRALTASEIQTLYAQTKDNYLAENE